MNSGGNWHLQRYLSEHFPNLSGAQRDKLISQVHDIFSHQLQIFAYQDLPRVRSELLALISGKCTVFDLSSVAAAYVGLDADRFRHSQQATVDKVKDALAVLEKDIQSAGGYAKSRPRDERVVFRVTLLCELWSKLTGQNPTHWNDEDRGPSSPCDQFVIAAFADFEEKPAWGAVRAALLENQIIDHQGGHLTDD